MYLLALILVLTLGTQFETAILMALILFDGISTNLLINTYYINCFFYKEGITLRYNILWFLFII